jgi:predicted ribosomally synthesized peptide with nif11-like leader
VSQEESYDKITKIFHIFFQVTEQQLQALLAKMTSDSELRDKMRLATDPDSFAALARESGIEITLDKASPDVSLISDKELETVAGGFTSFACFRLATTLIRWF